MVTGYMFEYLPQTGAPLRNRTVDLLLTIFTLQHCILAGQRADLAEREHALARASARRAHSSTACHSKCHSR
jgi:hypothetical protein